MKVSSILSSVYWCCRNAWNINSFQIYNFTSNIHNDIHQQMALPVIPLMEILDYWDKIMEMFCVENDLQHDLAAM
jgi:hypothetical protein